MFRFASEQKIFNIVDVRIGGQPGELQTVLIGNIFYKGMLEAVDPRRGEFDRKAVQKWISAADRLQKHHDL